MYFNAHSWEKAPPTCRSVSCNRHPPDFGSFNPPFCRSLPLDNSIIKTKLGAIKCRLRYNSESGALVKRHHGAI